MYGPGLDPTSFHVLSHVAMVTQVNVNGKIMIHSDFSQLVDLDENVMNILY